MNYFFFAWRFYFSGVRQVTYTKRFVIYCVLTILFLFQMKQAEVLGYGSTWVSLWLWKVMSADAFMHYTLIAIFFGKLWVSWFLLLHSWTYKMYIINTESVKNTVILDMSEMFKGDQIFVLWSEWHVSTHVVEIVLNIHRYF